MTRPLARSGAALLTTLVLALGATACGGDDESSGDDPSTTPTAADDPTSEDTAEEPPAEDLPTVGGADGGVAFVDTVDDPAATVDITAGGFAPADVTIPVGEVVKFTTTDDGIYSVIVGSLDGYTVTTGLDEYFRFEQPGAYYVREDISGAELTVTAE